ncbi:hypothetical protein ACF0H5_015366 [Mactra antiquata]
METNEQGMETTAHGQKMVNSVSESKVSMVTGVNILCVIGFTTLAQSICFLVVSMILDDVTVLPTDPLTIIGTMYAFMGVTFLIVSCILENWGKKKFVVIVGAPDLPLKSTGDKAETQFRSGDVADKTKDMVPAVDTQHSSFEGKLSNISEPNKCEEGALQDTEQNWHILDCNNVRHRIKEDKSTTTKGIMD